MAQATSRPGSSATQRLTNPLAYLMYAALGIAAVFWLAYAERLPVLGLDGLQLAGLWLALVLELFVLTACWGRSASGGPPDKLRHRVLWTTVVVTLLFSFFQNYASYRALLDRLDRLHADVTAQSGDVRAQLLQARYTAEQLKADVIAWSTAPEGTRASAELRVTSDLVDLRGRAQEAAAHLDDVVKSLGTSAPPGSGAATLSGSTLSGSMLTSVRNLADDAAQENTRMSQVLQGVEQDWNDNRSKPGMAAELQSAVDPKLWAAIDNAATALEHFEASFKNATTIPVSDLFVVMAVLDLSLVLFPWLLLLLFVSGRREIRIRRIYLDLWALGGGCNALLVRVLDGVPEAKLKDDGYRDPEVQRALEGRTFSDVEYLLSLSVLTLLVTAGWHLVLYPTGGLGLAQLVQNGVSVREFAMYLAGNLNVVTLGFLGAYLYGVGMLLRRFFASDLYPSAFLQFVERLIVIFVISLVLTILVPIASSVFPTSANLTNSFTGLPVPPGSRTSLEASAALAGGLAFFFGILPREFLSWLSRLVSTLPFGIRGNDQPVVAELEGVDIWVESRLGEEGIETVQAMATAEIERLVRRTYFTTARIVAWVDQALLYTHAGNRGEWMPAFRSAGIHTASELVNAIGYGAAVEAKVTKGDRAGVLFDDLPPGALDHVQKSTHTASQAGDGLSQDIIFEVAGAVWSEPNLLPVLNYKNYKLAHEVRLWAPVPGPAGLEGRPETIASEPNNGRSATPEVAVPEI